MSNITQINENNYNNENLLNSYHSDIAKFRVKDSDITDSIKLRDQFFLGVENFEYGDWKQYYDSNLKDIRGSLDVFSNEYEQVVNVERIMNRLDNIDNIDLENYDISLTNSNFDDNSVKLQLMNYQERYYISSNDLTKSYENILNNYDYEEEYSIIDKVDNSISQDNTRNIDESKLEKDIEDNRKYPNNPYGTIEDFVNEKNTEENLEKAKDIMDKLSLNYKDTVNLYNKTQTEISNALDQLENEKHYINANSELQSYEKEHIQKQVIESNGMSGNNSHLYNDIKTLYVIKNSSDYLSKEIENYQPNIKNHENNIIKGYSGEEDRTTELQKLKSVELEKNVIELLPKEDQENNYKETLCRLDKNKSTLKEDLKSYMSSSRIDNTINSVKLHFENIKVKADDIYKTFKDLGQWNTDNKFVKDIDNVITSVKELGKKHESELLKSDSNSIMNKLNNEYVELKDYVNNAKQDNDSYIEQKSIRSEYINNTLNSKQINVDFDPENVTKNLTDNQKSEVYNYLKDMNNHYNNRSDTSSMIKERDNNLIINQLESDNPKLKDYRNHYINLKQSLSPINLETSNEKLNGIIKQSNRDISKMNRLDKIGFKEQRKEETKISNQNSKANKIKNNDMFKKMDKLHEQSQKEQNTHSDDLEPKKKAKLTR